MMVRIDELPKARADRGSLARVATTLSQYDAG
jgi:hypothetical protein